MSFSIILIGVVLVVVIGLVIFIIKMVAVPRKLSAVPDLIKQGRTQIAVKTVKNILQKEPRSALAHYYLGQIYLAEKKGELALMEFRTVGSMGQFIDINETEFRKTSASLYERYGQLEEALKEYILLVKSDQNNSSYYHECARLFDARGKSDVAYKYAKRAVELDPRSAKAHYTFGMILYKLKKPSDSKIQLEECLKFDQTNYDCYFYLGKLLKDSNDPKGALAALEKAQKSPAYKVKALIERGSVYMSQNNWDSASIELERVLKYIKDPTSNDNLYARWFLATCFEQLKNLDKAIEQWEAVYAIKPQFQNVAEKLAQYQEYRSDDHMKDFLTCGREEFIELCKAVSLKGLNLAVQDVMPGQNDVDFIAIESDNEKWLGTKKMPWLVKFIRVSNPLDDSIIRSHLDNMKKYSIIRGAIVTSSTFSRVAIEFAENRSVELYQKDQLQGLLKKASEK